jgi:hypothetical protein
MRFALLYGLLLNQWCKPIGYKNKPRHNICTDQRCFLKAVLYAESLNTN